MFQLTLLLWKVGTRASTKNVLKIFAFIDIIDQIEIRSIERLNVED